MTGPPRIDYRLAAAGGPDPWSPWPLTIAFALVAAGVTAASAYIQWHLVQVFHDFGMDLPLSTRVALAGARLIWDRRAWVALVPLSIVVPLVVIPRIPAPATPQSRRRVARAVHWLTTMAVGSLVLLLAAAFLLPTVSLIESVAGPAKP